MKLETSTPLNETHFFRGFDYGIETYNEIRINLDFEFEEGKTYSLELTNLNVKTSLRTCSEKNFSQVLIKNFLNLIKIEFFNLIFVKLTNPKLQNCNTWFRFLHCVSTEEELEIPKTYLIDFKGRSFACLEFKKKKKIESKIFRSFSSCQYNNSSSLQIGCFRRTSTGTSTYSF